MRGVADNRADGLCNKLGFRRVQSLGKYLGVTPFHNRINVGTLRFVVDNARKLSLAGRATLAQSVLIMIPSYLMQSMMIPKGLYEEIERIVR